VAKEPENDLAQLFAAALDEETRQARPPAKARPPAAPPPGGRSVPPSKSGSPKRGNDDTMETSGAGNQTAPRPPPAAPSRSMAPPDPTNSKVATVRPAPRAPAPSSISSISKARPESLPGLGTAPARTAPPAAATGSGTARPSAPTASAAPSIRPAQNAPSSLPSPPAKQFPTQPPGPKVPQPSGRPGLVPSKSTQSSASFSAISASAIPGLRPSAPPMRNADPDGLNVLPRSEAQTLDKVPAMKRNAPLSLAPPTPLPPSLESRSSLSPNSKAMASGIRGRPAAELSVESAAEQLDHKGRSRPIFAPRSPRPTTKKLHPAIDLIAGLFPGARWMARERVASGLAYAIVGLFTLLPAIIVFVGWSTRESAIERLMITRSWIVVHAAVLLASLFLFELVRSGAALDPPRRHLRAARFVAAVTVPAIIALVLGPTLVKDAPGWVEPVWLLALPMVFAGLVATVDVLARGVESNHGHRAALVTASMLAAGVLAGALMLTVSLDLRMDLARKATDAGFTKLPGLIRALHVGS